MSAAPRTRSVFLSTALAALVWMTAPALAAPEDRVVTFQVHTDPSDSQSPVRLTFTLHITPAARNADAIGWRVETVEVAEHAADGTVARTWSDPIDPATDPTDLWWITHADPENPSPKEFLDVPQLQGTAAPQRNTSTPLRYALTSSGTTDPTTGEKLTKATYSIALDSSPNSPIVEGDDDPVEVGGSHED